VTALVTPAPNQARVETDVLVVGAGPAGLYAAYYAGFRGLSVSVVDSLSEPGGQLTALYPEKLIYDVAGFPAIRGRELVEALVRQAAPFRPQYLLGEQARHMQRLADRITVTTEAGTCISCRAVVVTAGIGTFTPRPLPAGEEFLGRGLVYFVRDLKDFAGRDVLVVGGGDSAFDWALALEPIARSVTLVHRRAAFRAHQHTVNQVLASSVQVLTDRQVQRVSGSASVERAEVVHRPSGTVEAYDVQAVIAALGFTADLGPLTGWGLVIRDRHVVVDTRMGTGVPGVFAAGDITDYPGKVRLISVGFGEAAIALNNAATFIDPRADLFPGHSTETPAVA
jgi:thioredoxin reductase